MGYKLVTFQAKVFLGFTYKHNDTFQLLRVVKAFLVYFVAKKYAVFSDTHVKPYR